MIRIEPISRKYLSEAGELADSIFSNTKRPPSVGLSASIDKSVVEEMNRDNLDKFKWFKYWVAIDSQTEKIVGTVGIYEITSDADDACWLGWFCVDPNFRGKGTGKKLLKFAIKQTKLLHKKYLRLYTSTDPEEKVAQYIYENLGFQVTEIKPREKIADYEIFYRQLSLK